MQLIQQIELKASLRKAGDASIGTNADVLREENRNQSNI